MPTFFQTCPNISSPYFHFTRTQHIAQFLVASHLTSSFQVKYKRILKYLNIDEMGNRKHKIIKHTYVKLMGTLDSFPLTVCFSFRFSQPFKEERKIGNVPNHKSVYFT